MRVPENPRSLKALRSSAAPDGGALRPSTRKRRVPGTPAPAPTWALVPLFRRGTTNELVLLGGAFEGAFEGSVERGFRFFVLLLRDLALLVFHLELEDFFFQCFEQHRGTGCRWCSDRRSRSHWSSCH